MKHLNEHLSLANRPGIHSISRCAYAWILAVPVLGSAAPAAAQCANFARTTDTIRVAGDIALGNQATYEARVLFTAPGAEGNIFNEWIQSEKDRILQGSQSTVWAYTHNTAGPSHLEAAVSLNDNAFHHLAYVLSAGTETLFLDGAVVAQRAAGGGVGNGTGSIATVGAISRDVFFPSFLGKIDTLRISSTARYTSSFAPPGGDLGSDAFTELLYNFNEAEGSTTISDLSGKGHTGTLGVGFTGATAPTLGGSDTIVVPEGGSFPLFGAGIAALALLRLRRGRTTHDSSECREPDDLA